MSKSETRKKQKEIAEEKKQKERAEKFKKAFNLDKKENEKSLSRSDLEKIYGALPSSKRGKGMQRTFENVKKLEALARGEKTSTEKLNEKDRKFFQQVKYAQARGFRGYKGQGDVITSKQEEERAKAENKKTKRLSIGGLSTKKYVNQVTFVDNLKKK